MSPRDVRTVTIDELEAADPAMRFRLPRAAANGIAGLLHRALDPADPVDAALIAALHHWEQGDVG